MECYICVSVSGLLGICDYLCLSFYLILTQGMNMLVAVGLLFLDEETTFWLLVMIIDKMTPRDYYTPGLLGAQADQVCIK